MKRISRIVRILRIRVKKKHKYYLLFFSSSLPDLCRCSRRTCMYTMGHRRHGDSGRKSITALCACARAVFILPSVCDNFRVAIYIHIYIDTYKVLSFQKADQSGRKRASLQADNLICMASIRRQNRFRCAYFVLGRLKNRSTKEVNVTLICAILR